METIGNKIKRLRRSKGLSLMDLVAKMNALKIDISDTALSKIETGKTKSITVDLGKGLANAFDISFNELFDIETNNSQIKNLKELVFESMIELRSNKEHFKIEELIEKYGEEAWVEKGADEFVKYQGAIRDFYFGLHETLINKGFCTLDEFRNYNIRKRSPMISDGETQKQSMDRIREVITNFAKEQGLPYP
jgi:transcriptional regulator with XRE-family HTH domain